MVKSVSVSDDRSALHQILSYRTQAVERLDKFFMDSDNDATMFRIAAAEVGEQDARDMIHEAWIYLREFESRGRGHYDTLYGFDEYGETYSAYIFGALRSVLKGKRFTPLEVYESDLMSSDADSDDIGFLARTACDEDLEGCVVESIAAAEELEALEAESPMVICQTLKSVCDSSKTEIVTLVRAVKHADNPGMDKLASTMFESLRKSARRNSGVVSAVRDFVRIYAANPDETENCLVQLGVVLS